MRGAAAVDGYEMSPSRSLDAFRLPNRGRRTRALTALAGAVAALAVLAVSAAAAGAPTLTPFAGDGGYGTVVAGPALSTHVSGTAGIGGPIALR